MILKQRDPEVNGPKLPGGTALNLFETHPKGLQGLFKGAAAFHTCPNVRRV